MARSLAFWLDIPSPDNDNTSVELHFNYWSLNSGQVDYLDIGVKISTNVDFGAINFYLPFSHKSLLYKPELGKTVCADSELISAIFNGTVNDVKTVKAHDTFDISFSKGGKTSELRFFTQILAENKESHGGVKITPAKDGVLDGCELSFPSALFELQEKSGYFRFRIILNKDDKKSISQFYKPKNAKITNHFETIEMVDFRLNEARDLPAKIRSKLNNTSSIKGVHFFLIREASSEYKMSHSAYHRCRILEKDLWNNYLKEDDVTETGDFPSQMLIYHWKNIAKPSENIESFSAFAKFTERHVRKMDVFLLLLLVVSLGILSSSLTNILWLDKENRVISCIGADELNECGRNTGITVVNPIAKELLMIDSTLKLEKTGDNKRILGTVTDGVKGNE